MKKMSLVLLTVLSVFLVSCEKVELPFITSPENEIVIGALEDIRQDEGRYEQFYDEYVTFLLNPEKEEGFDLFHEVVEELDKDAEKMEVFSDYSHKYFILHMANSSEKELDEYSKNMIDNYLRFSRLGDENATEFLLSDELKEYDPIGKVKTYMEEEEVVVTEILFPEAFEKTNYDLYPNKYTYRYILKGTVKGQPFEKEIVQEFYLGYNLTTETDEGGDIIMYIKDIPESKE